MIQNFEQFINESTSNIKKELDNTINQLKNDFDISFIARKNYKGDGTSHSHLQDCDYFVDIIIDDYERLKKEMVNDLFLNINNFLKFEKLSSTYKSLKTNDEEYDNKKLVRLYFKIK